jgi:hypothetical protein
MPPETIALAPIRGRRLPRFTRVSQEERPAFRLTDRDREMLRLLYEYRFLTAEMVDDLVQPVALTQGQEAVVQRLREAQEAKLSANGALQRPQAGARRVILHRLMVLYHAGYCQRLKLSDSEPIVYALGNKGADVLTLYYGVDRQKIDWTSKNREAGELYVRHGLMISRFRHALVLALRGFPDIRLEFWQPSGAFKETVQYAEAISTREGKRSQTVKGTVIPDGYFALRRGGALSYFCLEADRSKMTNARYFEKLQAYHHFWKSEIDGKQHPSGMQAFRVLTITLSEARKDNLRRTAQGVGGSNMFWFACERSWGARPQDVLSAIWQTPKDAALKSIIG